MPAETEIPELPQSPVVEQDHLLESDTVAGEETGDPVSEAVSDEATAETTTHADGNTTKPVNAGRLDPEEAMVAANASQYMRDQAVRQGRSGQDSFFANHNKEMSELLHRNADKIADWAVELHRNGLNPEVLQANPDLAQKLEGKSQEEQAEILAQMDYEAEELQTEVQQYLRGAEAMLAKLQKAKVTKQLLAEITKSSDVTGSSTNEQQLLGAETQTA